MPWEPHIFVTPWDVTWYWYCVPDVERRASSAVADAQGLLLPGADADTVDLLFQIAAPGWWEKRLAAWRGGWSIQEKTIPVGDEDVRIYYTDAAWAALLFDCQLAAGCGYGSGDCPVRPPYSTPDV